MSVALRSPEPVDGDPLADAAVESALRRWAPSDRSGGDLLAAVEREAERGDEACSAFVSAAFSHPAWADPALLDEGQRLGLALAIPTGAVLLLGGLVEVYDIPEIADVLGSTRRLQSQTWTRLLETGRFIRDIHLPGALSPDGEGLRALIRVRLLHAMIRTRIAQRGRHVITQEQMAFTLCAHSHVVRRSLSRVGVPLTSSEARAHHHLWRMVGHALGVEPRWLARSPGQEVLLYQRLQRDLCRGRKAEGRDLAARAIDTIASQARLPRGLVASLARRLVGQAVAERLRIAPHARWTPVLSLFAGCARVANGLRRRVPWVDRACTAGGITFANLVLATDPGAQQPVGAAATCGTFATLSNARRRGLRQCAARPSA